VSVSSVSVGVTGTAVVVGDGWPVPGSSVSGVEVPAAVPVFGPPGGVGALVAAAAGDC